MPETTNSNTEAASAEETFMNSDPNEATTQPAETDASDKDTKPVSRGKRALVWLALIIGSWALVLGIGYLVYSGLNPKAPAAVIQTAAPAAGNASRTVTVPAVRGVNAANCKDDEIIVDGNRLVFKNGCAKPVFYGQEK